MRLTTEEIKSIKDTFYDVFEAGEIYLFGSRVIDVIIAKDKNRLIEKEALRTGVQL